MTEEEWLASTNPFQLENVPGVVENRRKTRLYGVTCCRRVSRWFHDPRLDEAVDAAERYADGGLALAELERWNTVAGEVQSAGPMPGGDGPMRFPAEWQAAYAVSTTTHYDEHVRTMLLSRIVCQVLGPAGGTPMAEAQEWLCRVFRDIFGNPFRPVAFDPAWRSDTVVSLARGMYESRDFSPMPILADALQDAGCEDADVLTHCRDANGIHVRGCWVVDLVLGKS
jgi:hypothetical protein